MQALPAMFALTECHDFDAFYTSFSSCLNLLSVVTISGQTLENQLMGWSFLSFSAQGEKCPNRAVLCIVS